MKLAIKKESIELINHPLTMASRLCIFEKMDQFLEAGENFHCYIPTCLDNLGPQDIVGDIQLNAN